MLSTQLPFVFGSAPLQLGDFFLSPLGALALLVGFAVVILVGRFFLKVAWRLVVIGIIVVGTLYILGLLGFNFL
jgi:hypothetical protein